MSDVKISNHMQRDAIETAIKKLNMNSNDLHEVGKVHWRNIIEQTVKNFVTIDNYKNKDNLHWAWLKFRVPVETAIFTDDFAYKYLETLIDDGFVWFIVEDTFDKLWVYKARTNALSIILNETPYCEYYIVSLKFDWLLCENHHGVLFAVGKKSIERLAKLKLSIL